ncbi:MAG: hypothetical protein FJ255_06785 [Phycisphaerae bacterium]|nr:hypothetical protein [Phycisphaerae bacterium]
MGQGRHTFDIHLRLRTLAQLLNSLDPAPFHERDLDDDAADFIIGSALDAPRDADLRVVIHLDEPSARPEHDAAQSIHNYFRYRAAQSRRQMRELMRHGRRTLLIGLAFLAACLTAVQLLSAIKSTGVIWFTREALVIVGWVALWRPLEIFLYEWWPIRWQGRLFGRLERAPVEVRPPSTIAHAP